MKNKDILIVGAGPVGLSAGLFLHKHATIRIIEKLPEPDLYSKAFGVSPRTLELLEPTGATEIFLQNGRKMQAINIYKNEKHLIKNDFSRVKHRYPFMLVQSQADSEAILTSLLEKRGTSIERGVELTSLSVNDDKIISEVSKNGGKTGTTTSDLLLGTDGARSTVRDLVSMPFEGDAFEDKWLLYDIEMETSLNRDEAHTFMLEAGACFMVRIKNNIWRVISNIPNILERLPGNTSTGEIHWESDFRISHRLVASFNSGSVYFAGDSAHIHSGLGARGMNLGIEDAYVFSKLFKKNELSLYNPARSRVAKNTIDQVKSLTDMMRGKSLKSKSIRILSPVVMPILFPLIRHKIVKFVLGIDHEV